MKIDDFNALEAERREDIIWEWGFLIAVKKNQRLNTKLYAYSDFFIEVNLNSTSGKHEQITAVSKEEFFRRHYEVVCVFPENPFIKHFFYSRDRKKIISQ